MGETSDESLIGARWRVVTSQGGPPHVSSIVLSEEEARESLDAEEWIHRDFGWIVTRGEDVVVCRKMAGERMVERVVTIRKTGPHGDEIIPGT